MSKSKYPKKIDTSMELPQVRNNILQMGSEAINSLRSAVINIEKTLGINPQGSLSQTLSQRLSKSLDETGNIKTEAISKLGLLSGPITNRDVSDSANISESKVNLDYPTALLYSEISGLFGEIKKVISQLIELNREISSHVSEDAINRHLAKAIKLEEIFREASDVSTNSLSEQNLQDAIKSLISGHINYSGQNITSSNNSHSANQIYFDNLNTTISSNNVQDAITELDSFTDTSVKDHQNILHGNILLENDFSFYDKNNYDANIIKETEATSLKYNLNSDSQFSDFNMDYFANKVEKSDYLYAEIDGKEKALQVAEVEDDGFFSKIKVFGNINKNYEDSVTITSKKIDTLSPCSLHLAYINNPNLTSKNIVEIISPNSTYIVSKGLSPSSISSSVNSINIYVDFKKYEISSFLPTAAEQTPGTIVEAINEKASELNALFAATTIKTSMGEEIAIYCRVPNTPDNPHTLKVERGSDDAIDFLGFSKVENSIINGTHTHSYIIGGTKYSGFSKKLDTKNLTITSGSNIIQSPNADLTLLGIKKNDIIHITESLNNSGSYIVKKITANQITLDMSAGFSDETNEPNFLILNNTCSLSDMNFIKTSGTFTSLVGDVFLDGNNEAYFDSRLEYSTHIVANESIARITDFEGYLESFALHIDKIDSETIEIYIDDLKYKLSNSKNYLLKIKSSKSNLSLDLWVPNTDVIINYIDSISANLTFDCNMSKPVSNLRNLMIGRLNYHNFNGRFSGKESLYFKSLFERGSITEENISSKYKEIHIEKRFLETRSSGVIYGCKASDINLNADTTFSVDITSGVCYILGKRFEIEHQTISSEIELSSTDKVFIYIDSDGIVRLSPSEIIDGKCYFSKDLSSNLLIGVVEYDNVSAEVYDLRLNISNLDKKVLDPIIVSKEEGFGHFAEIGAALKLAKRFSEIYRSFEDVSVYIKSGHYRVSVDTGMPFPSSSTPNFDASSVNQTLITSLAKEGLWIDFPVNIYGDGDSTKIEVIFEYSNIGDWSNSNSDDAAIAKKGFVAIAGSELKTLPAYPGYTKLSNGKVSFEKINFFNTSVVLYDADVIRNPRVSTQSVSFNKCKFENILISPSRYSYRNLIIYNRQNKTPSDGVRFIGGFSIKECKFIDSNIAFVSPNNLEYYSPQDEYMLLDITDNVIISPGADYMIDSQDVSSMITETTSIYGAKITNNSYIGLGGKVVEGDKHWVSTIPSGLNIHGDVKVGDISAVSEPNKKNSATSEFYTNVDIKNAYSLNVGGKLDVGSIATFENSVIMNENLTVKDNIRSKDGNLTIESGSISAEGSITSESSGVSAKQDIETSVGDIKASKGSVYAHKTVESGGSLFYGSGEKIRNAFGNSDGQDAYKKKRKNSYLCTTIDLGKAYEENRRDNFYKVPVIDHGIVTKSFFVTAYPNLTYEPGAQYTAWLGLSDTHYRVRDFDHAGGGFGVPPFKLNTLSMPINSDNDEDETTLLNSQGKPSPAIWWPEASFMSCPYDGHVEKIVITHKFFNRSWLFRKIHYRRNFWDAVHGSGGTRDGTAQETPGTFMAAAHKLRLSGDDRVGIDNSNMRFDPDFWEDIEEYLARLNNEKLPRSIPTSHPSQDHINLERTGNSIILTRNMLPQGGMPFSAGDTFGLNLQFVRNPENEAFSMNDTADDYGFYITISFRYYTRLDGSNGILSSYYGFNDDAATRASKKMTDSLGLENVENNAASEPLVIVPIIITD